MVHSNESVCRKSGHVGMEPFTCRNKIIQRTHFTSPPSIKIGDNVATGGNSFGWEVLGSPSSCSVGHVVF